MMAPVKERADFVIDTSRTSTAQLREELLRLFGQEGEKGEMTVSVTSFGFKYGLPLEADLVFDVRFMPNPFYMEDLRPRTGLDQAVADYVFHFPQTQDYMRRLEDLLAFSLPLYAEEGKTSLTIAVGCTGGHHRSVAVTHALAGFIHGLGYQVLRTTDMTREAVREGAGIPRPPGPWPQGGRHRRRPRPVQHAAGTEAIYGEHLRHRHGGG